MGKNSLPEQSFLAKALYDNVAESQDELAFRKGDIVTVYETDTNGLEGWWLCSLRGKHGIAPGNRLKVVAGLQENSNNVTNQSFHETPPRGDRKRGSWDTQNKVVTPKKIGEVYAYQQQNTSVHDYDVPPTRYNTNKSNTVEPFTGYSTPRRRNITTTDCDSPDSSLLYDSPSKSNLSSLSHNSDLGLSSLSLYSTPPSHKLPSRKSIDVYDVPPSRGRNNSLDSYDVPSNRSSMLSTHSSESVLTCSSGTSNQSFNQSSSNPSSFCGSARSSMDISPQDLYDVPPSRPRPVQQSSHDSGLDMYDSPVKTKSAMSTPASVIEDYDVPKQKSIEKAIELGIMDLTTYNTPPKNKCMEHALDDFYDTPKNNTLRKDISDIMNKPSDKQLMESLCVYDIPPQVTRDSVFSSRSDSTDGLDDPRSSSCSVDSHGSDIPMYDDLPYDLDAAMDLLMRLQQDVQKSASRLLSYVSSTWRVKDNLERRLYEIKQSCNTVKSTLEEFVEFAEGSLGNSLKLQDRKLAKKLYKQISPLQQTDIKIGECVKNLNALNWQSSLLASDDAGKEDDLGFITSKAKELTSDVRKLASMIQGNSTLLFRRAGEMTIKRSSEVKYENVKCDKNGKSPNSKPPIAPKNDGQKVSKINIQHRPLPAPPSDKRPLPPTPDELKSIDLSTSDPSSNIYSMPKSDKEETYAESYEKKFEKAVDDILPEYDYVQLETKENDGTTPNPNYTEPVLKKSRQTAKKEPMPVPNLDTSDQSDDEVKKKLDDEMKDMMNKMTSSNETTNQIDYSTEFEDDLKTPVNKAQDSFQIPYSGEKLINFGNGKLDPNDKQVLVFYSEQLGTHSQMLSSAIDQFFGCVESNSPPKVFISRSKFIVLSAHKLVYIGDSLHRNLMNNDVRNKIMYCANQLCECLKMTVNATKVAALQYPSVPAVQDMVDRVVEVSQASHELKLVISQAAAL